MPGLAHSTQSGMSNIRSGSVNLVTCNEKKLAEAKPKWKLASTHRRVCILLCKIVF